VYISDQEASSTLHYTPEVKNHFVELGKFWEDSLIGTSFAST
jgi:hypothetical protein